MSRSFKILMVVAFRIRKNKPFYHRCQDVAIKYKQAIDPDPGNGQVEIPNSAHPDFQDGVVWGSSVSGLSNNVKAGKNIVIPSNPQERLTP
ncbi:MAG: hypothetical protein HGJ94_04625 [Desulfosarcina sp.]|nr:hypothetical protein [Desulfosarcina sp.]MBC2744340.1 hypothetical protein [Desulfosarcina sp.]MBC2767249.1 hypothetical protein [Desulfosarcina sp.]